ncbi:F0F1 ATP synthase subunit delta [Alteromonas mediterranea]|jgi:F-type H+-transporting ATPase subunit delta|uniref:F0F1 ATP synthase subunit delta n=1 Tax=Alteromonas mediterranea TaxID=314275 RepID=UPI0009043F1D|nr:F0F1 ATP synthase subunit delta [Alteromonas mediterranea]APD95825.1 F0F1 ATP synthase subunit delta [Alteromonas mediterranea]APD99460.1 F0F1 ATP synthase subunit delta [Alteromonas mediterranea]APE03691.1 F0F1 ATP synthase subunit delta [Alteromonas mediterranea]QDG36699.1 F0F1 ATP synthase subunit delta [Alteromonas mediterranea]QDG40265.1 F0F1 ATP synthase subunit delta [Alteromonas mediterranea]
MSELTTVARPYAKAAFDFAVEKDAIAKWQEMLAFAGEVAANEDMHQLLTGAVAADTLADIFNNVCGEQLDEHGQNLVKVLAENKRLAALPEISTLFDAFKADYDKEVEVDVTSASTLTDAQQTELVASLEKRLARKVKLNCNVDPALIAGMVINAGDTVIDGSVKSKLNRLADALQA